MLPNPRQHWRCGRSCAIYCASHRGSKHHIAMANKRNYSPRLKTGRMRKKQANLRTCKIFQKTKKNIAKFSPPKISLLRFNYQHIAK
jgi:hypothetical protein